MTISVFSFVMFGIVCGVVGANAMLLLLKHWIINPMSKNAKSALKGWGETLDLLAKAVEAMPKVEADGSMKSPIQIKKEE